MPEQDTPVLDLLEGMTAMSLEVTSLDARDVMLVRIAALVASDAPAISYALNLGAAGELDVDAEEIRGVFSASRRSSARRGLRPPSATSSRCSR